MKKNKKDPLLKIRYAHGLGDIIACILHSKPIAPITYFVTGQKTPCQACQTRRQALNIIFPISLRRFFFKNEEEQKQAFIVDAKDYGYEIGENENTCSSENKEEIKYEEPIINNFNELEPETLSNFKKEYSDYTLLKTVETDHDDLKIVLNVYKKIDK
jgi:hypothetical protein